MRWCYAAVSVALVVGVTSPAFGHPFAPAGTDWEGLSELVQLAREEVGADRVVVTDRIDLHLLKPEDGVILVHPERPLDAEGFGAFMRHGGRVVLLDDYGTGDSLLAHFGIRRVPIPEHPRDALRKNPRLAIAEPASAHPLVRDVTQVVTNHATGVEHPDLSPVLVIRSAARDCGERSCEQDVLLAEAGAVGQGRFLAVGDPSIVINAMLRYPGNKAFARAILRYGVEDDTWGTRGGRLYIAVNDFEQRGSYGESAGFLDDVRAWWRGAVDALEAVRRDGIPPLAAFALAAAIGLAIVLWVGSRATRTHKGSLPRFTRPIPLFAQGGVAGHAAVIGAPGTSRVLAMLEVKSALEEAFGALLGLEEVPPPPKLLAKVKEARLLDAEGLATLERLLLRMANVESSMVARQAKALERIRDRDVVAAAETMSTLLAAAKRSSVPRGYRP